MCPWVKVPMHMAFFSAQGKPFSMRTPWRADRVAVDELLLAQKRHVASGDEPGTVQALQVPFVQLYPCTWRSSRLHEPTLARRIDRASSDENKHLQGTRGRKRPTRAILPLVLHWRHRSLRGPLHSIHKWLVEVLGSLVLHATPHLVPDLTGCKLVHLLCVGGVVGIWTFLALPGVLLSTGCLCFATVDPQRLWAPLTLAAAGATLPLQHFAVLQDRAEARIIHACCHGVANVVSLSQKSLFD